jgi:hypothetical protein
MNGAAVPFIALFLIVIQGGLTSICLTELARTLGKRAVWLAVIASIVVAAIAGYAWTYVLSTSVAYTILASVLVSGGIAYNWAKKMERDIAEQLRMAHTVAKFGLENFDQLDTRREGEFGSGHLEAALSSRNFTEGGHWLLRHMQSRISDIGHVAGVQSAPVAVPHGAGHVHVIYRVNRRDLESYEGRIGRKYRAWR